MPMPCLPAALPLLTFPREARQLRVLVCAVTAPQEKKLSPFAVQARLR
jgi:hypothetical protein